MIHEPQTLYDTRHNIDAIIDDLRAQLAATENFVIHMEDKVRDLEISVTTLIVCRDLLDATLLDEGYPVETLLGETNNTETDDPPNDQRQ